MKYLDAHTHVQFSAYDADRADVIRRALDAGVWLINVGSELESSRLAVAESDRWEEGVYSAVGLHPGHATVSFHDPSESSSPRSGETFDPAIYRPLVRHPKTLAIGECGLDYFRIQGDGSAVKNKQREAFAGQIALSNETGKPLMIHCRNAFHDLIPMLIERKNELLAEPGIIHFFTGTLEEARQLMDLGFSFTFGGSLTFPPRKGESEQPIYEVIRALPLDRLLSETDAPYLAPVPYRGKRNEPLYVIEAAKKLAELKGIPVEEMREAIFENARRVLKIPG